MARLPKLPEPAELLGRLQAGEKASDIALERGTRQASVHIKLRRAGYTKKDWRPPSRSALVADVLRSTVAVNDRITRVQRAVLTRNFADVTNDDIAFAVDTGWLPERFATDPLGLGT